MTFWSALTDLGDSGFLANFALGVTLWLAIRPPLRPAAVWVLAFGTATFMVIATKLAFLGWGIGIHALDFTGISGHSMLSAAIFPILAFLVSSAASRPVRVGCVLLACLLATAIGFSRLVLQVHSPAEVAVGLGLGFAVAFTVIAVAPLVDRSRHRLLAPALLGAMLLFGFGSYGERAPSEGWLAVVAVRLSGHAQPYSRTVWRSQWAARTAVSQWRAIPAT